MLIKEATAIAGTLGYPSKMPGTSYGISATKCQVGAKLAEIKGSTCEGCYALKGNYLYDSVKMAHDKRIAGIEDPLWTSAMVTLLRAAHKSGKLPPFHRWHDSGDLQSVEHLTKICAIAALMPELMFWLPTREAGILAAYIKKGGTVPDNLTIRVSATMVDGNATKAWPQTSGVHHLKEAQGRVCPAPTQDNQCGTCRACWSRDVAHVSYHKH